MYSDLSLFIDGRWRKGSNDPIPVINPATEEVIGMLASASTSDLDEALAAADRSFPVWKAKSPYERSKIMRKAADLLRERIDHIAPLMTMEQGKTLAESRMELGGAADVIDWFAEEGRRTYGRIIPSRMTHVRQLAIREPVGPVAAFTPWNFPVNQAVRKISAALASGCTIILKGPEETPSSCAELVRVFDDAGVEKGALSLVFGNPAEISEYLIAHPVIKKISFTGSTVVGKKLAELAGRHMKRATMELGGHAPVIVFDDADLDTANKLLAGAKFRNAGQVCVAPTRFMVQESVFDRFVETFTRASQAVKVGNGLDAGNDMGALANSRRIDAMESMIADAVQKGGKVRTGGKRVGNKGYFFEPTVLTDVSKDAKIMKEEPFGPIAIFSPFSTLDEAVAEANRLPYGLAAYAYTRSAVNADALSGRIESGMISINHHGLALPEIPFGGIKDSGYGSEGGTEAMEGYLNTKLVTQANV